MTVCGPVWPDRMVTTDNTYSRFVNLAKIVLPLAAIALLSTLFLFSKRIDPEASLPYSQVEIEQLAEDQRVTAPAFAGVTQDGMQIRVSAETARPSANTPGRAEASKIEAELQFSDGTQATIRSDTGVVDTTEWFTRLTGGVAMTTSDGFRISTNEIITALDRTDIKASGAVQVESPLGELSAGQMQITGDAEKGHVLVFNQGVKLIYRPGN